jgi:hypothetical protein
VLECGQPVGALIAFMALERETREPLALAHAREHVWSCRRGLALVDREVDRRLHPDGQGLIPQFSKFTHTREKSPRAIASRSP